MGPVIFHRQLTAFVVLSQQKQALAFGELLRKICEQLRSYFAVPPLRLANSSDGDELAPTLFVILAARDD